MILQVECRFQGCIESGSPVAEQRDLIAEGTKPRAINFTQVGISVPFELHRELGAPPCRKPGLKVGSYRKVFGSG